MSEFEIVRATGLDLRKIDSLNDPNAITGFSKHLGPRESVQIVQGFESGSYEMVSSFVWIRAMTVLRKELAKLGMEFIGEILGRFDIDDNSAPQEINETEAINLAENLGMVSATEAMRLRQAQSLVNHFNNLEFEQVEDEEVKMSREEALVCLKACIKNILAVPKLEFAQRFSTFRTELENRPLKSDDPTIEALDGAPYFFKKTTLNFLLASIKNSTGAQLQNALHNTNIILPLLWKSLKKTELWQVGHVYAELYSNGQDLAVAGLKRALLKVNGFDYVPETTRSNTFTKVAAKVLAAHESFNNYHSEGPAIAELCNLGTTIPMPAFPVCATAVLAVFLGNIWGHSWSAQGDARRMLKTFSQDKWMYYLNECFPLDSTILHKLDAEKPASRWFELVSEFQLADVATKDRAISQLIEASVAKSFTRLSIVATRILNRNRSRS